MGLFGPSKSELEARIEDLANKADMAKSEAKLAEDKADRAHKRADRAERRATEKAEDAAQIAHALSEIHTADVGSLGDKRDEIEILDEPAIVWKATQNHIVKLLLPEGTTVVILHSAVTPTRSVQTRPSSSRSTGSRNGSVTSPKSSGGSDLSVETISKL